MLRSIFITLSKADWARRIILNLGFAWKMANRFIAGEHLDDAIDVVKELNAKNINTTLDHLGEHTTNEEESQRATTDILNILDVIDREGVRANVSIKLSQIGLGVDNELCAQNLVKILSHAKNKNNFVRIDMEDSSTVDATLDLFRHARDEKGFDNVGLVIQSYLYRSEQDVRKLMKSGTPIRLCKGAYKESPDIAFPNKRDVDNNYDVVATILFQSALNQSAPEISPDGRFPPLPAIATHDEKRIQYSKDVAEAIGLGKKAFEFQMLHGIRRDLQESLVRDGYQVRVYVPFGTQWYPYFMRRLAERPANIWFFVSNILRG